MILELIRRIKTREATLGELWEIYPGGIGSGFICFTLEDVDRNLLKFMPLEQIKALKIPGKTAIPIGEYQLIKSPSNRFNRIMPRLLNVPGFDGILIHPGNKSEDTSGCILVGNMAAIDWLGASNRAFDALFPRLNEKNIITIK